MVVQVIGIILDGWWGTAPNCAKQVGKSLWLKIYMLVIIQIIENN